MIEITRDWLEIKIAAINRITNRPEKAVIDGRYQVGHYYLDTNDEGLYTIRKIISTMGGSGRIDAQGFDDFKTDREILCWIEGLISGIVMEN